MQASKHFIFMEALVRRILEDDAEHQLIHEEFYRLQAGLSGEAKLKNTLSDYSFRSEHATLFNFECINSRGFSHQIDALLFTPNFIIVFEVKQISGTLSYKASMNEFSRITENGVAENFINPFDQVFRHKLFIEQILSNVEIDIPVLQLVVVANYRAILDPSLKSMPILHLSGLPHYLEKLYTRYPATSINPHTLSSLINQHAQTLPARLLSRLMM